VTDEGYLDFLRETCLANGINLVVPTIDTELAILARGKDSFADSGILLAISSPHVCTTFHLKTSTESFFLEHGFLTPRVLNDPPESAYPLFAKLDNSSCSKGAARVDSPAQARTLIEGDPGYIFQEFIEGDEFTIDAFIDSRGEVVAVVPRLRLEVRAGEVSKALAVKDPGIIRDVKKLCACIQGAYGTLTIQLIRDDRGRFHFIEINPRFGGGYPLSWRAGADFADYLIRDAMGEDLTYSDKWRGNTLMLRYDHEEIVHDFSEEGP
jgi:carbamoyl-phosphate synthase large subunit